MKRYCRILMIMAFAIGIFVIGTAPAAHASFILKLDDLGTSGTDATITDNGSGDLSSGLGTIIFAGATPNFFINVTTGISKPAVGSPSVAQMDLNSVNVASSSGGTLVISLTDTGFSIVTGPSPFFVISIGGSTGDSTSNSLTYDSYYDATNTEFNTSPPAVKLSLGPFVPTGGLGSGAFSDATKTNITLSDPFALTQEITLTLDSNQTASFNATSHVSTPEPSTLLLLGVGLLGTAVFARRRKKKQS